jgi:hypothetical protein
MESKVDLTLEYVGKMQKKIKKEDFLNANHVIDKKAWQVMKVVNDQDGTPDYITNGDGPAYSKQEYENLKKSGKAPELDFMP